MKTVLGVILAIAVSLGTTYAVRKPEITFAAKEGTYWVRVPRKLFFRSSEHSFQPSAAGNLELNTITATGLGDAQGGIALMHIKIPEALARAQNPDTMLQNAVTDAAKGMGNAKIGNRTRIRLNDEHPGIEANFEGTYQGKAAYGRMRFFRVETNMVATMLVSTNPAAKDDPTLAAYLDTFTLQR